jgi:hypothetical protein
MTGRRVVGGLGALALVAAGGALAQSTYPVSPFQSVPQSTMGAAPADAGGFPVGPLTVVPGLDLAQGYNDNLRFTSSDTKSSAFTMVSPYVRALAKNGPDRYDATLRVSNAHYWSSSNDDFTNYSAIGNADLVFDGRTGLKLRAEFRHAMDPIGSTDRPVSKTPDQYNHYGIDGVFRYGAPGAQGRIEIDAGAFALRYTNHHDATDDSNRNTWQLGGTFYWRVMPRTEVLLQARHIDFHYTEPTPPSQSSGENRYYLGLKWEATAKTTGLLKVGYMTKNFDSSARKDYSGASWEAGVRWSPLTYSIFELTTSRITQESTGVGDAILSSNYSLVWNHAWSSRLRTQALAQYRKDDFLDSSPSRLDNTYTFGARVNYDFRRWLRLGAEYTYTDRNSNLNFYDYKRNLFLLTVGATM